jgi:hypothetical protein
MSKTCAAIFLGASRFDRNSAYTNPAFKRSKDDFEDYLRRPAPQGLGVPTSRVLNLFNSTLEPGTQLRQVSEFAEQVRSETPGCERDLIVYYVGHGYFAGYDRQFYVALASMDQAVPDATGLRIASLGEQLKRYAKSFRIYYLLDCCFAGEALKALMAGGEGIAIAADAALKMEAPQGRSESPRRGSALLCATSKDDFAMAPSDLGRTVFSDALIEALCDGDSELGPHLTLAELAGVVWDRIQAKHRDTPDHQVRPFVHAPDQSDGDVSTHVPLFPNPAWRPRSEPTAPPVPKPEREAGAPAPRAGLNSPPPPNVTRLVPDESSKPPRPTESLGRKGTETRTRPRLLTRRRVFTILALLVGGACLLSYLANNANTPPPCTGFADQPCHELLGTADQPGTHETLLGTAVQPGATKPSAQPQHTPPTHKGGHHTTNAIRFRPVRNA